MSKDTIDIKQTSISPDGRYHLYDRKPLYQKRFLSVMSFHTPGVAAVEDSGV